MPTIKSPKEDQQQLGTAVMVQPMKSWPARDANDRGCGTLGRCENPEKQHTSIVMGMHSSIIIVLPTHDASRSFPRLPRCHARQPKFKNGNGGRPIYSRLLNTCK